MSTCPSLLGRREDALAGNIAARWQHCCSRRQTADSDDAPLCPANIHLSPSLMVQSTSFKTTLRFSSGPYSTLTLLSSMSGFPCTLASLCFLALSFLLCRRPSAASRSCAPAASNAFASALAKIESRGPRATTPGAEETRATCVTKGGRGSCGRRMRRMRGERLACRAASREVRSARESTSRPAVGDMSGQ